MSKTITRSQYFQLMGLKAICDKHTAIQNELRKEVRAVVNEPEDSYYGDDFLWDNEDPEKAATTFLRRIEVTVEPPEPEVKVAD